ncbi:MAG TPA: phosphatase PAP2 family protein [Anaeromyxobacter sp.]|nr:phosphatase PAP2 family protein [Anaeromyxobacter sp.]
MASSRSPGRKGRFRGGSMARGLAVAAVFLLGIGARADDAVLRPKYDLLTDGAVTAVAAGATLTLMALQPELAPLQCRWCEPGRIDAKVEEALRWQDPQAAAHLSDGLAVALAGGALGYSVFQGYRGDDPEAGWANALLITEATSVAMLVDTGVKYTVGRQRPYAWRGETGIGSASDRNLSFFSGHATFAFAIAASSSTLLVSQKVPGAGAYSVVAFSVASAIAYFRVAADQHYASDALVGAAVGTAIGWAIPHFFHPPVVGQKGLAMRPGGIAYVW